MKVRESGMPQADYWNSFFDAECVSRAMLGTDPCAGHIVEFGSGYGTFTFPVARRCTGTVHALDIEPGLIAQLQHEAGERRAENIHAEVRDFVADGTGLEAGTQTHALIFNLLHLENPVALLHEARRVLRGGGQLSVIHWRSDIPTPRGPPANMRPTPHQCAAWLRVAGFEHPWDIDLRPCCPFHFGIAALCP